MYFSQTRQKLKNRSKAKRTVKKKLRRAQKAEELRHKGVTVCITHPHRPAVVLVYKSYNDMRLIPLCDPCYIAYSVKTHR